MSEMLFVSIEITEIALYGRQCIDKVQVQIWKADRDSIVKQGANVKTLVPFLNKDIHSHMIANLIESK